MGGSPLCQFFFRRANFFFGSPPQADIFGISSIETDGFSVENAHRRLPCQPMRWITISHTLAVRGVVGAEGAEKKMRYLKLFSSFFLHKIDAFEDKISKKRRLRRTSPATVNFGV